jgi:hypothetical protein
MKNLIKLLIIILVIFVGCTEKKEKEKTTIEEAKEITLEGMWKLKSGVWDNEDGTFLRYPEDSITQGDAYNIYSKTHFMTIAKAPLMEYFRGELTAYSINGNEIYIKTIVSNFDSNEGLEATWTFKVEGDLLKAELGKNNEVWERVE